MNYADRNNSVLTIAFIDVNDLKKVNDQLGHKYGDQLLKTVSDIIIRNIRSSDAVSRLGGDEFLIIFPDCKYKELQKIMKRICDDMAKENKKNKGYQISISYGLAKYSCSSEISIDELINKADKRMYQMKRKYKKLN